MKLLCTSYCRRRRCDLERPARSCPSPGSSPRRSDGHCSDDRVLVLGRSEHLTLPYGYAGAVRGDPAEEGLGYGMLDQNGIAIGASEIFQPSGKQRCGSASRGSWESRGAPTSGRPCDDSDGNNPGLYKWPLHVPQGWIVGLATPLPDLSALARPAYPGGDRRGADRGARRGRLDGHGRAERGGKLAGNSSSWSSTPGGGPRRSSRFRCWTSTAPTRRPGTIW